MRTTITMAEDVAAAVDQLRREQGVGPSEAINELIRRGLSRSDEPSPRFVQTTSDLGETRLQFDNIAELLDTLEGPGHR